MAKPGRLSAGAKNQYQNTYFTANWSTRAGAVVGPGAVKSVVMLPKVLALDNVVLGFPGLKLFVTLYASKRTSIRWPSRIEN